MHEVQHALARIELQRPPVQAIRERLAVGGAFSSREGALATCAAGAPRVDNNLPIFTRMPELGIRCCKDSAD